MKLFLGVALLVISLSSFCEEDERESYPKNSIGFGFGSFEFLGDGDNTPSDKFTMVGIKAIEYQRLFGENFGLATGLGGGFGVIDDTIEGIDTSGSYTLNSLYLHLMIHFGRLNKFHFYLGGGPATYLINSELELLNVDSSTGTATIENVSSIGYNLRAGLNIAIGKRFALLV